MNSIQQAANTHPVRNNAINFAIATYASYTEIDTEIVKSATFTSLSDNLSPSLLYTKGHLKVWCTFSSPLPPSLHESNIAVPNTNNPPPRPKRDKQRERERERESNNSG